MPNENELQLGMSVDTAEALNNVKQFGADFKRSANDMKNSLAEASKTDVFAEMKLQALQLQEEIKQLERSSSKLIQVLGEAAFAQPESKQALEENIRQIERKKAALNLLNQEMDVSSNKINTNTFHLGAWRTGFSQATYVLYQINPAAGMFVSHLSPMISGLQRVNLVGGGFKAALAAIGSQLMGPLGIVAGIGILTTVITTLIRTKKEAVDITKEYAGEIQQLRTEMEKMSKATLDLAFNNVLKQQSELVAEVVKKGGELTDEQFKQSRLLKDQENILRTQLRTIGDITNLENERAELQNRISGLRGIDPAQGPMSPRNIELLQQYQTRIKEIDKALKTLKPTEGKTKADEKTYREKLVAELKSTEALLAGNLHLQDRIHYEGKRRDILKELTQYLERYITLESKGTEDFTKAGYPKGGKNIRELDITGLTMDTVPVPARPNIIKETNAQLEIQLALGESLREAYQSAGGALASAMASSIQVFGKANSLLQIFIQSLIQAAVEALVLRGIMAGFDFLKSILNPTSALVPSGNNPGGGDLIYKPVGSGIVPTPGTSHSISVQVSSTPQKVFVQGEISGRNIRLNQKINDSYLSKYYGKKD